MLSETTPPIRRNLTLVTVTFRAEDELQRLQARSLARFAPADAIARVIVIDNGSPQLSRGRSRALAEEFGPLTDQVSVVAAAAVAKVPASSGWMAQQVLKLTISAMIDTPFYLLLDAKNHMVRPVAALDLLAPDGRARGGLHTYDSHPLLPRLRTTLDYLGIDFDPVSQPFPRTATPFVMHTEAARDVVHHLERRSGRPFAEEFVSRNLSEFFLYSAWLLRRDGGWEATYDGTPIQAPTVWGGQADAAGVRDTIRRADETSAPFFGVHRRALSRLDAGGRSSLRDYWISRGLVRDDRDFARLLSAFRRQRAVDGLRTRTRRLLSRAA